MSEGFAVEVSVAVNRKTDEVLLSFGPIAASDVADLIDHLALNRMNVKHDLIEHVADALLSGSKP